MVHRPKSIYGNALLFLVILGVAGVAVPVAFAVPGSLLAAAAAGVALTCIGLVIWHRRVEAGRERAWVGQFSFGDVIDRMRAREAIAPSPSRRGGPNGRL